MPYDFSGAIDLGQPQKKSKYDFSGAVDLDTADEPTRAAAIKSLEDNVAKTKSRLEELQPAENVRRAQKHTGLNFSGAVALDTNQPVLPTSPVSPAPPPVSLAGTTVRPMRPRTSVSLGEGAVDESQPAVAPPVKSIAAPNVPFTVGQTKPMEAVLDYVNEGRAGQPQPYSGAQKLLADKYVDPGTRDLGEVLKFKPSKGTDSSSLAGDALRAMGYDPALNDAYLKLTGRNLIGITSLENAADESGNITVYPTRRSKQIVEAFAQGTKAGGPEEGLRRAQGVGAGIGEKEALAYEAAQNEAAPDIAEVEGERKAMGALPVSGRVIAAPTQRLAAELHKTLGGAASVAGLVPNRISDYLNTRGEILSQGASLPPLTPQGEQIIRAMPEKAATAAVDLGLSVAKLALLKKASGLSMAQIMVIESGLQNSDKPARERAIEAAKALAMGKILDGHMGRIESAGMFGVPALVEGAQAHLRDPEHTTVGDVALNTGLQAGLGLAMGGKPAEGSPEAKANEPNILTQEQIRNAIGQTEGQRSGTPTVSPELQNRLRIGEIQDQGATVLNPEEVAQGAKPKERLSNVGTSPAVDTTTSGTNQPQAQGETPTPANTDISAEPQLPMGDSPAEHHSQIQDRSEDGTFAPVENGITVYTDREGQGINTKKDLTGWKFAEKPNEHGMVTASSPDGQTFVYVKAEDVPQNAREKEVRGWHVAASEESARDLRANGFQRNKPFQYAEYPDPAEGTWIRTNEEGVGLNAPGQREKTVDVKAKLRPIRFESPDELYAFVDPLIGRDLGNVHVSDVSESDPLFDKNSREKVTKELLKQGYNAIEFGEGFKGEAHEPGDYLVLDPSLIEPTGATPEKGAQPKNAQVLPTVTPGTVRRVHGTDASNVNGIFANGLNYRGSIHATTSSTEEATDSEIAQYSKRTGPEAKARSGDATIIVDIPRDEMNRHERMVGEGEWEEGTLPARHIVGAIIDGEFKANPNFQSGGENVAETSVAKGGTAPATTSAGAGEESPVLPSIERRSAERVPDSDWLTFTPEERADIRREVELEEQAKNQALVPREPSGPVPQLLRAEQTNPTMVSLEFTRKEGAVSDNDLKALFPDYHVTIRRVRPFVHGDQVQGVELAFWNEAGTRQVKAPTDYLQRLGLDQPMGRGQEVLPDQAEQFAYPNIPERPKTIQAQLDQRGYALIPKDTPRPNLPKGYRIEQTPDGAVYYDPNRISAEKIRNTPMAELLGHVEPKSPEATQAVVARDAQGNEVHASAVSPENVDAQVAKTQEQFPGTNVKTGGPELAQKVLNDRAERTTGIAQRVEDTRRTEQGQSRSELGQGISAKDSVERGRQLLADGRDPQSAVDAFRENGSISADGMALVRAKHEELAKAANRAFDESRQNLNDPRFKAAEKARQDWWENAVKPMQTEWHKTGMAQQGETGIDTGTFYGLYRAFKDSKGREPSQREQFAIKNLAQRNASADADVQTLSNRLAAELNRATGIKDLPDEVQQAMARFVDQAKRESRRVGRQATRKSLDDEAVVIKQNLAAAFQKVKSQSGIQPSGLARFDPEGEITKQVIAYAKNRVKAGVTDAAQLIDDVHGAIKDFAGDVTRREVAEAVLGQGAPKGARVESEWAKTKKGVAESVKAEDAETAQRELGVRLQSNPRKLNPVDASAVWNYARENYVDQSNTDFADVVNKTASDLGVSPDTVRRAFASTTATKRISDEMWKKMSDRRQLRSNAEAYVRQADASIAEKAFENARRLWFLKATVGHGAVAPFTHAPVNAFIPSRWADFWRNFGKTYQFMVSKGAHERSMVDLENSSNYALAKRAGLANDPKRGYDEYQSPWMAKTLGKLGISGNRAFDALKTMRQDMFDSAWTKLTNDLKTPDMAKGLAEEINASTGASKALSGRDWPSRLVSKAMFAAPLEASRWDFLVRDNYRALKAFANPKKASAAELYMAKRVASRNAQLVATYGALLAANAGLLKASGSDDKINFTDPTKSDFWAFKVGGHVVSPAGGMLTAIRFVGNLAHIGLEDKRPREKIDDASTLTFKYGRSKLSPLFGTGADIWLQSDYSGRPLPFSKQEGTKTAPRYTWPEYVISSQTPIPIAEAARDYYAQRQKGTSVSEALARAIPVGVVAGTGIRVREDFRPHKSDSEIRQGFVDRMRSGDVPPEEDLRAQGFSSAQITKMKNEANLSSFQVTFSNTKPEQALDRFERMDDRQRFQVKDQMAYKAKALLDRAQYLLDNAKDEDKAKRQAERDKIQERLDALGLEPASRPKPSYHSSAFKPPRAPSLRP